MSDLTIIDGHNYLFRAFYGVPPFAKSKSGVQVNALYGFFASLRQIVREFPNNKLFVVFDSETGIADKQNIRETYKAGRATNNELFKQLPYIKQILDLMNIQWLEHPGYEADDIIATLATHWSENIGNCYISSNDFDFVQMVSDKIILLRTVQGKLINCDAQFVRQRFNITPEQYIEYMALVGDKTDNISGVPYIGKKIASDLLNEYGNLDNIFNNLDTSNNEIHQRLSWCKNTAYNNREFITMNRHIPICQILDGVLPETDSQLIQRKISFYMEQIGI